MGVESKWLARWFAKLMSKLYAGAGGQHQSTGDGSMHIGQSAGPVTTVHQVTQHFYAPCAPPVPVPQGSRPERRVRPRPPTATEQSHVLALMDRLPDRIAVLDFMEREFDTRMVIHLDSPKLFRLRRYMEVILDNGK